MSNRERLDDVLRRDGFVEIHRPGGSPPIQHLRLYCEDGRWCIRRGYPGHRKLESLPDQPVKWVLMPIFEL